MPAVELLGEGAIEDIEDIFTKSSDAPPREKVRKHVIPRVRKKSAKSVITPVPQTGSIIPGKIPSKSVNYY